MSAPQKILDLIATFKNNADHYTSTDFNEAMCRIQFVNPLFHCLGWDMDNEQGFAPDYQDVIHEASVIVDGAAKAPDYSFGIGRDRKFFVEAKKPSVNIKKAPEPAFQLRRYAWSSKKLPLSILTNFAEFAVYDGRVPPDKDDKPSVARILYFTYDELPDKWDELASTFSKSAILKGSFDKFAQSAKGKRGTATVDAMFLEEIEDWRLQLARNLALRNPELSQRELNYAVQMTIDRIIFLRMCEDRGIEDYGQLSDIGADKGIYELLKELFRKADRRYNSGLFHFEVEAGRDEPPDTITLALKIDDKLLRGIIDRLYYPESPYVFSVIPAEILGHVYEQFLGKVITLTKGHQARVEDKPEVKKAGGVYYTPSYIVDYIVRHTVGKLLAGASVADASGSDKTPSVADASGSDKTPSVADASGSDRAPSEPEASATVASSLTPKQAAKLRILDPACGSGSFLLGAYQYLLDWHLAWYNANDPERLAASKNPPICASVSRDAEALRSGARAPTGWKLTTAERKRILLANIYGVDIDTQAVEVTKLSLLLKVLEGESRANLERNLFTEHERALPDLSGNIKCGNSLIGSDFYDGKQMTMFDDDEQFRINVFDWDANFPAIMKADGFDAVIGNPPWGGDIDEFTRYFELRYPGSTQGYKDSFKLFIDKGMQLSKPGGYESYVVPSAFMFQPRYIDVRRLLKKSRIDRLWNVGDKVFGSKVVAPTCVFVVQKTAHAVGAVVKVLDTTHSTDNGERQKLSANPAYRVILQETYNRTVEETFVTFFREMGANEVLLSEILDCKDCGIKHQRVGCGMEQKGKSDLASRLYYEGDRQSPDDHEYLIGADLNHSGWHIRGPSRYFRDNHKAILKRDEIVYFNKDVFDLPEKIVWRQTSDRVRAAILGPHWFANTLQAGVLLRPEYNLRYVLGLLNSQFLNFIYIETVKEAGRVFPQVKMGKVRALPFRVIDFANPADKSRHDEIVERVERMLALHQQLAKAKTPHAQTSLQAQIDAADRRIDQIVYELYGLTADEIRIVEDGTGKTEAATSGDAE